ncbi:hypothetical protein D9611_009133 [Ephemerocybe angulata]|uniref:DUF6533 domain-containing protein n=1 Tax=Ephemerocybe angulata TaxID=980116 RepID=A0A8H5CET2_9AGAR|nr:hypothetical protein D9611_009133 [Tulosesus angulatus]
MCQYLTTLEEEISIIWPQKWRKGKMLFLIIRYNPFVLTLLVLIDNLRNYSVDGPGQPVSASTSIGLIVHHTFTQLQDIVVPMLACRLLLNMRETELDCGAHTITSIFFAPPRSNGEPENAAEDNLATRQAPPYAGLR